MSCPNTRFAALALLSLLAPTFALGQQEPQRFKQLLDDSWEFDLAQSPVFATRLGDHRFDDRLSDESLDNQRARHERRQQFHERWQAIDRDMLQRADQINYDIFGRLLNDDLAEYEFGMHLLPIDSRWGFHIRQTKE